MVFFKQISMKPIKYTYLFILLCFFLPISAQTVNYFNKTFKPDTTNILTPAVLTISDGYLTVGGFNSFDNYSALFVHKIDWEGNTVWFKIVEEGNTLTGIVGGGILEKTLDGNYIMVGVKDTIGLAGNLDIMMIKFNEYGDVIWKKTHGTSTTVEGIYHITPTQDGGYIMCGIQRSFTTSNRFYVLKTDAFGNKEWDRVLQSNKKGVGANIIEAYDGGYITAGYVVNSATLADMYIAKLNGQGFVIWENNYNSTPENDNGAYITKWKGDKYLLTASIRIDDNINMYVAQLSMEGVEEWYKVLDANGTYIQARPVIRDMGFTTSTYSFTPNGSYYSQVIRFDENGNIDWLSTIPGLNPNDDWYLKDIAATADGGYILSGFNYSEQSSWVVKTDSMGYTCSYIGCDSTAVTVATPPRFEGGHGGELKIYPNPAQNQATVYLPAATVAATGRQLLLYNASGQLVRQAALPDAVSQYTFSVAGLPAGIYFCRVGANMQKLVVIW
ncbi:T9SS C-terminal target domain-containing protein [Sphingobacteriales bacterium UPWRP_1]|nr:hypothetical protein B6N25_02395 [Sphingobacteriales bacterium TSM_CSS]PSJ75914.1 T9SS C-terminal target domain-containing protein [Sphingobacteriales bacterium UPWRP_1]